MTLPLAKDFVTIRTKDSKFNFVFPIARREQYTHVGVTSVTIPKTYYCLPSDATLTITADGKDSLITVAKGNYNPTTLSTVITNAYPSVSIKYNNPAREVDINKYVMTFSLASTVSLKADSIYLSHMLGFDSINTAVNGVGNVWTSPNCLDFQSADIIYIVSDMVKNQAKLLQEIVSNNVQPNTNIVFVNPDIIGNAKHLVDNAVNDAYPISILDENKNLMDFNGGYIVLTLELMKLPLPKDN